MKKTNIRVRANGDSKPVSPQAPNKPEPVHGELTDTIVGGFANGSLNHPATCEDELEQALADWSPRKRRVMADKFERWIGQMRFSADLLERFGDQLGEEPELVFPSYELAEALRGKTRAQCLAEAAKFEEWCATIRRMLGVKMQPATITSPN